MLNVEVTLIPFFYVIFSPGDPVSQAAALHENTQPGEAAQYYGIMAIPSTMLVDPEGRILATNLRGEKLHEELAKILK